MIAQEAAESSSDESEFPRRLGRYVLVCHLGEGGMGRVYLALSKTGRKEKLLVIKRFGNPRSHFTEQEIDENKHRFRREAQITVALAHPCIARTFDSVDQGARAYLVQEFVDGMTLEYLNASMTSENDRFPIPVAAYVVGQVARALDYLHDFRGLGLIHRDITPSNVMLSKDGEVKVIDFGIAKATESADVLTKPNILIGKPIWTAPEVLAGRRPDRRADLYSLGLLFWSMLAGRTPNGQPAAADSLPHATTFNLDLPQALNNVVVTAIAKDPNERFQTAREFLEAVAPFMPGRSRGAIDLASLVTRYQPVLEKQFLAEVVSRGRPLLASVAIDTRPRRRSRLISILVLPVVGALGVGIIFMKKPSLPVRQALLSRPPGPVAPPPIASESQPVVPPDDLSRVAAEAVPVPARPAKPPAGLRTAHLHPNPAANIPLPPSPKPAGRSAEDLLDQAVEALSRGDSTRALALARASGSAHPSADAYILIGRILFETDPAAAAAALETAVRLAPGNRDANRLLGAIKQRLP